jgi:hypothetical protein
MDGGMLSAPEGVFSLLAVAEASSSIALVLLLRCP